MSLIDRIRKNLIDKANNKKLNNNDEDNTIINQEDNFDLEDLLDQYIEKCLQIEHKNVDIVKDDNTNNELPNVYIITLKTTPDREQNMRKLINTMPFKNITFVIGDKIHKTLHRQFINNNSIYLSQGELGCLLSHLWCLRDIIDKNLITKSLVLEDDVRFYSRFMSLYTQIPDRDIVLLGAKFITSENVTPTPIKKVPIPLPMKPPGSHAILYTPKGAKHVYSKKILAKDIVAFDIDLWQIISDLTLYDTAVYHPPLIGCDDTTSSIRHVGIGTDIVDKTKYTNNNIKNTNMDNSTITIYPHERCKPQFRNICISWLPLFRNIMISLSQNPRDNRECVFIECRTTIPSEHIEVILRNAMIHIKDWNWTIICSPSNKKQMEQIIAQISSDIEINEDDDFFTNWHRVTPRLIILPYDIKSTEEYSSYISSLDFWNDRRQTVWIHQEDSLVFKYTKEDIEFIDDLFDNKNIKYIGAPFMNKPTPYCGMVGNGGFSIRDKSASIEAIQNFNRDESEPEDIYFMRTFKALNIPIATFEDAMCFSTESIKTSGSIGGHAFWVGNRHGWEQLITDSFIKTIGCNKCLYPSNNVAYDITFYNNANIINDNNVDISINTDLFYHPKQLNNLYPDLQIIKNDDDTYYILDNKHILNPVNLFIERVYNYETYDSLRKKTIKCLKNTLLTSDRLLLIFIGNEICGKELINVIVKNDKFNTCDIAICLHIDISLKFIELIKTILVKYKLNIYQSNEFGNDIVPTLLMLDCLLLDNKNYNISNKKVYKFHTKGDKYIFIDLVRFLINTPESTLDFSLKLTNCACAGHPNYYHSARVDRFNKNLYKKFNKIININNMFVEGSIFYTDLSQMLIVLQFMKDNYKHILCQTMYDTNSINKTDSYIHFMERLFGIGKQQIKKDDNVKSD